jgi:alpha-L-rhamnosidase
MQRHCPRLRHLFAFRFPLIATAAIAALWGAFPGTAQAGVTVGTLRCEYLDDPLGIDVRQPRLSWILDSAERGQRQTAYQVLVASTPEKLADGEGDLWDSGRVESRQSTQLKYAGKQLGSHTACFWKVRVWDKAGAESEWSAPTRWSMGLLEPGDWKAKWIGLDEEEPIEHITDAQWIWFDEADPAQAVPIATRYFRRTVEIPADRTIKSATLWIAADDFCRIFFNGHDIGSRSGHQSAKELNLTHRFEPGKNVIAVAAENRGENPNPAALVARLHIEFESGEPLDLATDGEWKTAEKEADAWFTREFDDNAWAAAKVIGEVGMAPWGQVRRAEDRRLPARHVRKEFAVEKPIRRAVVYYSGLGCSELTINGVRIGNAVLGPAVSEYPKRVYYVTADVTENLQQGANAIGVLLGNGRYYSPRSVSYAGMVNFGFPKLLLHLRIEHEDGSVSELVSDESWKLTTDGPIRANSEYDGEEYDARKELGEWTKAGYDDSSWQPAQLAAVPPGAVSAQMIDPIRVTETLRPIGVAEPSPGMFIVDMGQNLVGWCRIKVRGPAGTSVTLRHAETLLPDGNLYLANIRGALVTDVYTKRTDGEEIWEPRFTYHGFRFVEVTGWPGKLSVDDIEGRVVHDDVRRAGEFACSNELINTIYKMVDWGTRGNYRSMPTDCPQRDERQGWLGDRGEESRGEMYLYDNAALYSKWLLDMQDAQKDTGSVPDVCPSHWPIYSDNVTWPSSTVIIPNSLHRQFGDATIVASHYDSAKKWVDYMLTFMKNGIIDRDSYGDWCVPPEDPQLIHSKDPARQTNKALLATSYFYYDLRLMERYAKMLGKADDEARFAKLADDVKAAFNKTFYNAELGQYDNGSQTSCVLPLQFGLVPDGERQRVFDRLVRKITQETNNHIGTGLIGGQYLNRVLSDNGRADLAFTIATQQDYPSWGYMASKGATTVWELWNGDTADPAMNSGNHVMLVGDFVIWVYEYLAGIRPDESQPGFQHVIMRPELIDGLDWVKADHRSPYGAIESEWHREDGAFTWAITLPPNVTAEVFVPGDNADAVTEGGKPLAEAEGVEVVGAKDGRVELRVGSGRYDFSAHQ